MNLRGLVLEQDFRDPPHPGTELSDPRVWRSFRENIGDDPPPASAFPDLFAGDAPDWSMPDLFRQGTTRKLGAPIRPVELTGPTGARRLLARLDTRLHLAQSPCPGRIGVESKVGWERVNIVNSCL